MQPVFENLNPTGKWGKNTKRNAQDRNKMFLVNSKCKIGTAECSIPYQISKD